MTSGASDLVMVMPTDTFDSVAKQIRASGANVIQLLIADNNPAFHALDTFVRLAELARRGHIQLMVISSDEQTLAAAKGAELDVVGVDGARISIPMPPKATPPENTYATHVLPREELEPPIMRNDDALLLEQLYQSPPTDRRSRPTLDDDFDLDLNLGIGGAGRLDDETDYQDGLDEGYTPTRHRALDEIEDVTPSRGSRPYRRAPAAPPPDRRGQRRPQPAYANLEDDEYFPQQRGGFALPIVLGTVLVLLLIGAGFYMNRPVVAFWPPATNVKSTPFTNEAIPISESRSDSAIQAQQIHAEGVEVTISGNASQQPSPSGTARGSVQIINRMNNPIDLPVGTEFIGTNNDGQQVGFLIDSPATVPAAVTSTTLLGSSVQFGNLDIQVSARSPGSASNIGKDSITQMIVPGQPAIQSGDQIQLVNEPIEGGSEAPLYVVTEQDVRNVLGTGLSQLYRNAQTKLSTQAPQGLLLDPDTIWPNTISLGDPANYETPVISPTVGQPVDQANPVFTMTLRADFSALAVPRPVRSQLQEFLTGYFYQRSSTTLCDGASQPDVISNRYEWNGQQLVADGAITCTPKGAISPEMQAQVQRAVLGQSHDAAKANLDLLQSQGVIGGYQLPNVDSFSSIGLLVGVEGRSGALAPTDVPQGQLLPTAEPTSVQPAATEPAATEPAATEPAEGVAQ